MGEPAEDAKITLKAARPKRTAMEEHAEQSRTVMLVRNANPRFSGYRGMRVKD